MKLVFEKELYSLMYHYEIEMLAHEKLGRDLGNLLLSFLKEDPKPWVWPIVLPLLSPWDCPVEVDPNEGIDLPIFAP